MTHICVGNLTIIGSDNGLSPGGRQAIIWTNAGMISIGALGTNFSEILAEIITFSFKKMYLKVSSAKWRPFCLGFNVLIQQNNQQTPKPMVGTVGPYHTKKKILDLGNSLLVHIHTQIISASKPMPNVWLHVADHRGRFIQPVCTLKSKSS